MNRQKLTLKHPTGWFAAGREVSVAAELLSDLAFKVFVYLCLNANRQTGRIPLEVPEVARLLRKRAEDVEVGLSELIESGVALARNGYIEITDRYWPYVKCAKAEVGHEQAEYVRQVREQLVEPACVRSAFTPAEEHLAAGLYNRGVRLDLVRRAIWLGCARKYLAMLNGETRELVSSLRYFIPVIEEVSRGGVPDSYWEHVRQKAKQMEKTWLAMNARAG
jgi:hypothetical protein